jgi:NADH-quinone oxidoreductase subunit L
MLDYSMNMQTLSLLIVLAPLMGSIITGILGWTMSRRAAHCITILGVAIALAGSLYLLNAQLNGVSSYNENLYTWLTVAGLDFNIGFLIDTLTTMMMVVVTFVSLMVHIYTIGYMVDDAGYKRFFSYISLFTFAMLMLVMANNFVQLFFGWEAVGLVSYLLIGFWFDRPTAIFANLKAFLINRVGDLGFLLGIGLVLAYAGSLDYATVFGQASALQVKTISLFSGHTWSLMTVTCILLFIGAMGKSAQFPLHVWLPDSMEGPTPISALIHAATMVTAGIFMVARMSPLFELSTTALSFILIIGSITALFMGILGIIQTDIKRVVAYSTLSQLGYMTAALGVSAYSAAIFHLMTHAFFKALLFLGAGSVIIGMHHEQDMRKMGGLRRYMPITWLTSLLGSLALIGTPFFSGFYSKDTIIEAVGLSTIPGAGFAYFAVVAGVFITALYTFRMYFMVFHGKPRFDTQADTQPREYHHVGVPHESPWVVTLPLILLAILSVVVGYWTIEPMLYGGFFENVIHIDAMRHPVMNELMREFAGAKAMAIHAFSTLIFWLMVAGVALAWLLYVRLPRIPAMIKLYAGPLYTLLDRKYFMDDLYIHGFAKAGRKLGSVFWKIGDVLLIDGAIVNGAANVVGSIAKLTKKLQTGYIYHYAFAMIIGAFVLMTWWLGALFWMQ